MAYSVIKVHLLRFAISVTHFKVGSRNGTCLGCIGKIPSAFSSLFHPRTFPIHSRGCDVRTLWTGWALQYAPLWSSKPWPEDPTEKHIAVGFDYSLLDDFLNVWKKKKENLRSGKITKEEYFERKINWPHAEDYSMIVATRRLISQFVLIWIFLVMFYFMEWCILWLLYLFRKFFKSKISPWAFYLQFKWKDW